MNEKLRILVCCGNGAGTSLMIKLNVEKIIKKRGWKVQSVHHCAISEGKSTAVQYDIILCTKNFISMFEHAQKKGVIIIGLKNIMSTIEIEEKLAAVIAKE